jgi:carboxymethylenebutenolidase
MSQTAPRLVASDFHPEVMQLFDHYVHGRIDRRGFLDGATRYATAAGTTSAGLLAALSPDFASAQKVPTNDARIKAETMMYDSPQGYGKVKAYIARPAASSGALPVVLVVHENRGLNPHIEDVARRLALAGYIAVAPDALTPLGGYPGNEDDARAQFAKLDQTKSREDFVAGAAFARALPGSNGKLGAVGFCYGGGIVNMLATRLPDLNAAVPFYGPAPATDKVAAIKAPLLLVFAETDDFVNKTWPDYEAALKAANVKFEAFRYAGVLHGFHNDTTPRYDEKSATQAWSRTLDLFGKTLKA